MSVRNITKVIVQNPKGEILLLRRSASDQRRPGEWDFPGGGVDEGESFIDAAVRETREEAGLAVAELVPIFMKTEYYKPRSESLNRILWFAKVDQQAADNVQLSFEHDLAKWVTTDQALIEFPHPFYGVGLRYGLDHGLI